MQGSTTSSSSAGARALRLAGQVAAYAAFIGALGYFSDSPAYRHLPPDQAVVKLSVHHATQPVGECRQRSAEELANMPPNMRLPMECPRERSPLRVVLEVDGVTRFDERIVPPGLSRDSATGLYRRLALPAGEHRLAVRMNDNVRDPAFAYHAQEQVNLAPGQVLVIQFDASKGGFLFK